MGIYCIRNQVNNKVYIGSSKDLKTRLRRHKNYLKTKSHDNNYLQHAWDKYGKEHFTFEIIEYIEDENKLLEKEQFYINNYKSLHCQNGYNIRHNANNNLGLRHSDESRQKISKAMKSAYSSKEKHNRYGVPVSRETREKLSKALKGKNNYWHDKGYLMAGEGNPNSRLTTENVIEIKTRLKNGEICDRLAKEFNINKTTIYYIRDNKRWKHVTI